MTWALALLVAGLVFWKSALENRTVRDVLVGATTDTGPGAGTAGFLGSSDDLLIGLASAVPAAPGRIPSGMVEVDGKPVCGWVARELRKARQNGWQGQVTSGYRSEADQARVCATGVQPCAKPGESRHQGRRWPSCAVDVSDPEGLRDALPAGSPLKWAGSADPPHFSSGSAGGPGY